MPMGPERKPLPGSPFKLLVMAAKANNSGSFIEGIAREVEEKIDGMSGVHVMLGDRYLGAVGLEDKLRMNAREVIASLREAGVRRVCIFTGDRLSVAKRVGQTVGVDSIEAEDTAEGVVQDFNYLGGVDNLLRPGVG